MNSQLMEQWRRIRLSLYPTQRAIRTYIASQIGGGASSNVNLITAGLVVITGNTISTSNNVGINSQGR